MGVENNVPQSEGELVNPVGYGKPPESTRFKKGVSGNPKGRPKGGLNVTTVFMKTLGEKVVVNEHGQRKTVTKLEAAVKQLVNKAASGDQRSIRLLMELARDAEAKQDHSGSEGPTLSPVDQEIIDDILKRFSEAKQKDPSVTEADNGNTQRK